MYSRFNKKKLILGKILKYFWNLIPRFPKSDFIIPKRANRAVVFESDFFGDMVACLPAVMLLESLYDEVIVVTRRGLNAVLCRALKIKVYEIDLPDRSDSVLIRLHKIITAHFQLRHKFDGCDLYELRGDFRNFLIVSSINYSRIVSYDLTIPNVKNSSLHHWPYNSSLHLAKTNLIRQEFPKKQVSDELFKTIRQRLMQVNTSDDHIAEISYFDFIFHPGASTSVKRLSYSSMSEFIKMLIVRGSVCVIVPPDLDLSELRLEFEGQVRFVHCDVASFISLLSNTSLFIGMDSGFSHLAAATGIEIVLLSWHDNYADFMPYGRVRPFVCDNVGSEPVTHDGQLAFDYERLQAFIDGG